MSRDAAKRMLMAEAPKVPEHVLEMLLDVHEKNPAYFQEQMREVLRAEKSCEAKAAPRCSKRAASLGDFLARSRRVCYKQLATKPLDEHCPALRALARQAPPAYSCTGQLPHNPLWRPRLEQGTAQDVLKFCPAGR